MSVMDAPQESDSEELVLDSYSDGEVMSRFLVLPPVKALQFALVVTLGIGYSNGTKIKTEDNFRPLPSLYSFQDDTPFRHKLKKRYIKAFKDDDTEVETWIWDNVASALMWEEFVPEMHGIILESLMKRIKRRFKTNVLNSFIP